MPSVRLLRDLALTILLVVVAAQVLGLRWNATESLPRGLYRLRPATQPGRGDLVLVCIPVRAARLARARGYLGAGRCPGRAQPVGKSVIGLPGDRVEVGRAEVTINERWMYPGSRLSRDAEGRTLPLERTRSWTLTEEQLWIHSSYHPRSFDSRYFGPVSRRSVLGVLRPVWTFGPPSEPSPRSTQRSTPGSRGRSTMSARPAQSDSPIP